MTKKYRPNRWLLVKIADKGYKIFGTWGGGYLDGESWRLSSGVQKITEKDNYYFFHMQSGSEYVCYKQGYGASVWTTNILLNMIEQAKNAGHNMEVVPEDIDFLKINFTETQKENDESKKTSPQSTNTTKSTSH